MLKVRPPLAECSAACPPHQLRIAGRTIYLRQSLTRCRISTEAPYPNLPPLFFVPFMRPADAARWPAPSLAMKQLYLRFGVHPVGNAAHHAHSRTRSAATLASWQSASIAPWGPAAAAAGGGGGAGGAGPTVVGPAAIAAQQQAAWGGSDCDAELAELGARVIGAARVYGCRGVDMRLLEPELDVG
jgi:hypothetical protein